MSQGRGLKSRDRAHFKRLLVGEDSEESEMPIADTGPFRSILTFWQPAWWVAWQHVRTARPGSINACTNSRIWYGTTRGLVVGGGMPWRRRRRRRKKTCAAGISGRDFGKLCTIPFLTDRPSPVRNPPKSQISSSGSRSTHLLFSRPSFALHVLTAGFGGDEVVVGEWGKSGEKTPHHDGGLHIRTAGPK